MASFDIVCRTDLMEVDNVINGILREVKQRFDLAGTKCDVLREGNEVTITADDTMKMDQMAELLRKYAARRDINQKALQFGSKETGSGGSIRQSVEVKQGIDGDIGRRISKAIKNNKFKVQVAIQGSELRVSGKKLDELQSVIAFVKAMEIDLPLEYVNMRD